MGTAVADTTYWCEHATQKELGGTLHRSGHKREHLKSATHQHSTDHATIRQVFLPSDLQGMGQSNIKGLMRLALGVIAGHTADKAHDAHAQKAVIGLSSPDGHPVTQPCVPVSHALLHLLCGQQDCQPPRSLPQIQSPASDR